MFLCFKDTATTEIDTYVHTLSLHDALPICGSRDACCAARPHRRSSSAAPLRPVLSRHRAASNAPHLRCAMPPPEDRYCGKRSEAHTSELQSLMRISYAVFCLNTKKRTYTCNPA